MSELATRPAPVSASERILALDVLRGFAVLGILVMNIQSFAMPLAAYSNPTGWEMQSPLDFLLWGFAHLVAEQKFMTIFSILFGAGVALMLQRLEERDARVAVIHYRRTLGLILIGLAHSYLLWYGDILVTYGVCALFLYPFRRVRPSRLLIVGIVLLCVAPVVSQGYSLYVSQLPEEEATAALAGLEPSEEQVAREVELYRGSWIEQMEHRAPTALSFQTMILAFFTLWRAGGLMLIGMALYKWGVLTARRSPAFYRRLVLVGAATGLPLVLASLLYIVRHGFDFLAVWFAAGVLNYAGSLGVAFAYVGGVMWWCLAGRPGPLTHALGAAGRMALTNYLLQTILCTLVFYGFGLGLFGRLGLAAQWLVVLGVWAVSLVLSPWWLARYRFGPFEWLWRSMTYLRWQPMRR